MSLHDFLLFSSSSGERRHRFLMVIGHSRNKTFHERATEFYDVVTKFIFAERSQAIGSTSSVAFSQRTDEPIIGHIRNINRILYANFINQIPQRPGISFPIQFHGSAHDFCLNVVGFDGQGAIKGLLFLGITPQILVTKRDLKQRGEIEWIELGGALKILQCLILFALATQNSTLQLEYGGIIGKALARSGKFSQGALVIEIAPV